MAVRRESGATTDMSMLFESDNMTGDVGTVATTGGSVHIRLPLPSCCSKSVISSVRFCLMVPGATWQCIGNG